VADASESWAIPDLPGDDESGCGGELAGSRWAPVVAGPEGSWGRRALSGLLRQLIIFINERKVDHRPIG